MTPSFDYKRVSDESEQQLGHPIVEDAFPYRAYHSTRDARTSKSHWAMESGGIGGTNIYYRDDPIWKVFRPPWGARHCRCSWHGTTVVQAARIGVQEAKDWWRRADDMSEKRGGSPYQYLTETAPINHECVPFPEFSPDSLCEPGALDERDYPLILDDLQSGASSRIQRGMNDIRLLVPCNESKRQLRDSLMTLPALVEMASTLMALHKSALVAWPALISCFVSRTNQLPQGEAVSWQTLVLESMRHCLDTGSANAREQILPLWIVSDDANAQTLVELLRGRHWDVRKAAAERLGQLGRAGTVAIGPLEQLRSDRSKYVQAAAAEAINRLRFE